MPATRAFADDLADAPAYRCLNCGYVLDGGATTRLPACPRCGHGDWEEADAAALTAEARTAARMKPLVFAVRYVVPGAMCLAGLVLLAVNPGGFGVEGFGLFMGAGLALFLLNFMYRLGVAGDRDRWREERAREYFARHGRWPDEPRR